MQKPPPTKKRGILHKDNNTSICTNQIKSTYTRIHLTRTAQTQKYNPTFQKPFHKKSITETLYEIMQIGRWKPQTKQLDPKRPRSSHPSPIKQVFYPCPKNAAYFQGIPQA